MTGAAPTIRLDNASKWYGDVIGINQVSLEIRPGITGLLGPNGAGKSTMMKLITGQLRPGNGTVEVLGQSPWRNPGVFRSVGFCPDTEAFYDQMTALEFVTLMGRLSDLGRDESVRRAVAQLEHIGLEKHMGRRLKGFSKGMRQRTKLAAALVHDPAVLILDEPLNGLDPLGRLEMLAVFRRLGAEGRTVLVSSHILHEIEGLTDDVALIHHGRILAEGVIEEIRALIENQPLTLSIATPAPRAAAQSLAGCDGVYSLTFAEEGGLVVRTNSPEKVYETLQADVLEGRYPVRGLTALDDNLEAVFQYLVKE